MSPVLALPEEPISIGKVGSPGSNGQCRHMLESTRLTHLYGPAVRRKRFSSIWRICGLASMYPASDWSELCSGPPWISARVRSHYRTGLIGPFGSPVLARAGKTDPPSRLILSQTSAGKRCLAYVIGSSSSRAVPLFVPCGRSFVPARACAETPRARVVKAGRRAYLASRSGAARPRLDGPEHGATLTPVGTPSCPCCCIRSCAPC